MYAHPCPVVAGPTIELSAPNTQLRLGDNVTVGRGGYRWGQRKVDRPQPVEEQSVLPAEQWPPTAERAHRKANSNGELSFAGVVHNVGRAWAGHVVEAFTVRRTFYIAAGESIIKKTSSEALHSEGANCAGGQAQGSRLTAAPALEDIGPRFLFHGSMSSRQPALQHATATVQGRIPRPRRQSLPIEFHGTLTNSVGDAQRGQNSAVTMTSAWMGRSALGPQPPTTRGVCDTSTHPQPAMSLGLGSTPRAAADCPRRTALRLERARRHRTSCRTQGVDPCAPSRASSNGNGTRCRTRAIRSVAHQ